MSNIPQNSLTRSGEGAILPLGDSKILRLGDLSVRHLTLNCNHKAISIFTQVLKARPSNGGVFSCMYSSCDVVRKRQFWIRLFPVRAGNGEWGMKKIYFFDSCQSTSLRCAIFPQCSPNSGPIASRSRSTLPSIKTSLAGDLSGEQMPVTPVLGLREWHLG